MHHLLIIAALLCLSGCASAPTAVVRNEDLLRGLDAAPAVARSSRMADSAGGRARHGALAAVLKVVVRADGAVDYAAAKAMEPELNRYLVDAGDERIDLLGRREQAALLVNLYNACTLKMVVEQPGLRSVTDVPAARGWDRPTWVVDRCAVSLVDLEHAWIRGRFGDFRLLFALCHGARGSPMLRAEPYTGEQLERQLDDQLRRTLADPRFVRWDAAAATLHLSDLFRHYRGDFGDSEAELLRALLPWLPADLIATLRAQPAVRIVYEPFDWRLNGTW